MDNNSMKLVMAAEGKIPREGVIAEVLADISRRINEAIMPVSSVTAPFVVAMLIRYAEEIKKLEPGVEEMANQIAQLLTDAICVKMPTQKRWWNDERT